MKNSNQKQEIHYCNLIIPIWGEEYIKLFMNFTLGGILQHSNLPFIVENFDTTISIVSTPKSFETIRCELEEKHPIFKKTNIKFINIEDILTNSQYTFTLTVGYSRAINSVPEENFGKTLCILLNADFLASDSSLKNVSLKALEGYQAIYGASLRAIKETSELTIRKLLQRENQSTSSRELVSIALSNKHPTVTAMTVNNQSHGFTNIRQIFWEANTNSLFAKYFLLCIIGIVPQRKIDKISAYHDYFFVPTLTDENARYIFQDSDEFFMIELQPRLSEFKDIKISNPSIKEAAKSIMKWRMEENQFTSKFTINFHSEELNELDKIELENFEKYAQTLQLELKRKPKNFYNHYHWVRGVKSWVFHKNLKNESKIKILDIEPQIAEIPFYLEIPVIVRFTILKILNQFLEKGRYFNALLKYFPERKYLKMMYATKIKDEIITSINLFKNMKDIELSFQNSTSIKQNTKMIIAYVDQIWIIKRNLNHFFTNQKNHLGLKIILISREGILETDNEDLKKFLISLQTQRTKNLGNIEVRIKGNILLTSLRYFEKKKVLKNLPAFMFIIMPRRFYLAGKSIIMEKLNYNLFKIGSFIEIDITP